MNKLLLLFVALFLSNARPALAQSCAEVVKDTTRCGGLLNTSGRIHYLQNTLDQKCKVWVREAWTDSKGNKGSVTDKYDLGPKEPMKLGCSEGVYPNWGMKYDWTVVKCKPRR